MPSRAASRFPHLVSHLVSHLVPHARTLMTVGLCALCVAPHGTAHAQAAFRPVSVSDEQRSLGPGAGATQPPSTNLSPMAGSDRYFGTDARTLGADGRIIGADGRILYPPPLEQPLDPERYIVDKGDVLQARLWGDQNFDVPLAVDPDGRLFIPRVGYLSAHGRTLAELSAEILTHLRARFPKLQSAVTLAVPRTFVVRVTGAVGLPGSGIPVNAWSRASEAIQRAGGVLSGGSSRTIELHRAGGAVENVDLVRYPVFGDRSHDPIVLDGDWIHVPLATRSVGIQGGVNRPGIYELVQGTFAELLELAGGFSPETDDRFGLRIASVVGDARTIRLVDFKRGSASAIDPDLHHHDLITVPTLDEGAHVVIKGALNSGVDGNPQRVDPRIADTITANREITVAIPFSDGETLRGAIIKAGGLAPWADMQNAWIQHSGVSSSTATTPLATPIPSAAEKSASANGGRGERVPIDLRPIFTQNDPRRDIRLVAGDTVYIPSGRVDVVVSGHVMKPGIYGYSLKLNSDDYIALAGGETRDGRRTRARVVSLDGSSRPATTDVRLQPGDSITVPGKILTTAEWVTISLGVISIGLSATLLAYNLSLSR